MEDQQNPQRSQSPNQSEGGVVKEEISSQSSESEARAMVPVSAPPPPAPASPVSENEGDQEREYRCKFCFKKFNNKQALGGHQNAHKMERAVEKSIREAQENQFNLFGGVATPAGLVYPGLAGAVVSGHLNDSYSTVRSYDHFNPTPTIVYDQLIPQQIHYGRYNLRMPGLQPVVPRGPYNLVPTPFANMHQGRFPYPYHPTNNNSAGNQGLDGRFLTLGLSSDIARGQPNPGYPGFGLRSVGEDNGVAAVGDHQEDEDPSGLDLSLKL